MSAEAAADGMRMAGDAADLLLGNRPGLLLIGPERQTRAVVRLVLDRLASWPIIPILFAAPGASRVALRDAVGQAHATRSNPNASLLLVIEEADLLSPALLSELEQAAGAAAEYGGLQFLLAGQQDLAPTLLRDGRAALSKCLRTRLSVRAALPAEARGAETRGTAAAAAVIAPQRRHAALAVPRPGRRVMQAGAILTGGVVLAGLAAAGLLHGPSAPRLSLPMLSAPGALIQSGQHQPVQVARLADPPTLPPADGPAAAPQALPTPPVLVAPSAALPDAPAPVTQDVAPAQTPAEPTPSATPTPTRPSDAATSSSAPVASPDQPAQGAGAALPAATPQRPSLAQSPAAVASMPGAAAIPMPDQAPPPGPAVRTADQAPATSSAAPASPVPDAAIQGPPAQSAAVDPRPSRQDQAAPVPPTPAPATAPLPADATRTGTGPDAVTQQDLPPQPALSAATPAPAAYLPALRAAGAGNGGPPALTGTPQGLPAPQQQAMLLEPLPVVHVPTRPYPHMPQAPAQTTSQTSEQTPPGASLLLMAGPNDTLRSLYREVYRGVRPPGFETVAALNPATLRPGMRLIFPAPPDGWPAAHRSHR